MPMSVDVRLPRSVEPQFPPLCCRCLSPNPEERVRCSASRFSWWELLFVWLWWFRKPVRCHVPVCARCRPKLRRRKLLDVVALVAIVAISLLVVYPFAKSMDLSRQWQKLAALGGAFVIGFPYFLWAVLRPPSFDMTVRQEHVEYEFGNPDYAGEFFVANEGATCEDFADLHERRSDGGGGDGDE